MTSAYGGRVRRRNAEVEELRDWKVNRGDIRSDPGIAREILEFIEKHRVLSVAMTDAIIKEWTTKANEPRAVKLSSDFPTSC
jgi:hypothetical protein